MGPMPWTVNSEIYPLWARSTGNACSAGVNWTFNVLVSLTFLHMAQYLTYYGNALISAATSIMNMTFLSALIPYLISQLQECVLCMKVFRTNYVFMTQYYFPLKVNTKSKCCLLDWP